MHPRHGARSFRVQRAVERQHDLYLESGRAAAPEKSASIAAPLSLSRSHRPRPARRGDPRTLQGLRSRRGRERSGARVALGGGAVLRAHRRFRPGHSARARRHHRERHARLHHAGRGRGPNPRGHPPGRDGRRKRNPRHRRRRLVGLRLYRSGAHPHAFANRSRHGEVPGVQRGSARSPGTRVSPPASRAPRPRSFPVRLKRIMSARAEAQMGTESHYHSKTDRVFVRAITGHYKLKDELARLRALPRVRKGSEIRFVDGPQAYSRHYVEPEDGITQTLHIHLEEYGPGGKSQKHGHVNEAAFYIMDGRGYEIHDGVRYDWQAGDVAVVHNNCVHQHFNADPAKPARALVLKTKPMYMFLNMLFQQLVEPRPTEPAPGGKGFQARESEDDYNHAK